MRLFITPLVAGEVTVRGDEHHYLGRVRRARVGDHLEVVDGEGVRARATILAIGPEETRLAISHVEAVPDELPVVRALIPVIKGDRMDTCVEKLVEVGVDAIHVWPAARAVVKLEGARRESRLEHYQGIAQAAARQSGRASVPAVDWADSLASAIGRLPGGQQLVLDPGADDSLAALVLRGKVPAADAVAVVSGPEGGFAGFELDTLTAAGFSGVGLGPRVLRAESAPVVAVALVRAASKS
jgi:16S rRNA (uracil1498-N3)-methyltransferase